MHVSFTSSGVSQSQPVFVEPHMAQANMQTLFLYCECDALCTLAHYGVRHRIKKNIPYNVVLKKCVCVF